MKANRPVAASELAEFEFCRRAWAYDQAGHPSELQVAIAQGTSAHNQHAQGVRLGRALARTAAILILAGLALLAIQYL